MMTSQAPQPASQLNRPGSSGCRVTLAGRLPPLSSRLPVARRLRWPVASDDRLPPVAYHPNRPAASDDRPPLLSSHLCDSLSTNVLRLLRFATFQTLWAGARMGEGVVGIKESTRLHGETAATDTPGEFALEPFDTSSSFFQLPFPRA